LSIKLESVSKYYGEQAAVRELSFEAFPNEILGVLGPNGAGKSTTMKMICGYLSPDSGSIQMGGESISADPLKYKAQIGYLPESNPLYLDMYVREFLLFCAGIHGISHKKKRINDLIEMTGLGKEQHKTIDQLSKGYRQRVGLAQTLLHDPAVLVLDEPTSGLDPNQLVEIRQLIRELGREKTVLFSSHILQEVQLICDRIIVLNDGKLVANSSIADLTTSQEYASVVEVCFEKPLSLAEDFSHVDAALIQQLTTSSYLIKSNAADILKKELFDLAVRKQNRITALSESSSSIEDIFQSLTLSES